MIARFIFWVSKIGKAYLRLLNYVGLFSVFVLNTSRVLFGSPSYPKNILSVFFNVIIRTIPLVSLTGLFAGAVMALQSYNGFSRMNAEDSIPIVIVLSITRELGPVLCALMLSGCSAASMASELASMKTNNQINAMRTLLVDPLRFVVIPNVIAMIVALPILTIITDIIGILGGYLVCVVVFKFSSFSYVNISMDFLTMADVSSGLIKSVCFGLLMSVVACYNGYISQASAIGVGRATTNAVVYSSIGILFLNYILTAILF